MVRTERAASSYRALDPTTLPGYIADVPALSGCLGGSPSMWQVEEVGDGNLNLVFKVRGPAGGLAVKQALPYVRLVGESWPLPLSRAHYEHMALAEQARHVPDRVPRIHHYNQDMALIAMELLAPHIIMRRGMIAGTQYPKFVAHMTDFMAETLFRTSDIYLSAEKKKDLIGAFAGNTALCRITEDLVFTEPYMVAPNNRWTRPQLDPYAARFRSDDDLKIAVSRLKLKFMHSAEALLHGDLHTGSVMLTETDTRIIDPEFAFVGPMGFDVGAIIANFLISYFSQDGHEVSAGDRDAYRDWILDQTRALWTLFAAKFLALWRLEGQGDGYPAQLFASVTAAERLEIERRAYIHRLYRDSIGFAAAKMIRRILGLAHNIDLELIKDQHVRGQCEARALTLARELMVNTDDFASIGDVTDAARRLRAWTPPLGV